MPNLVSHVLKIVLHEALYRRRHAHGRHGIRRSFACSIPHQASTGTLAKDARSRLSRRLLLPCSSCGVALRAYQVSSSIDAVASLHFGGGALGHSRAAVGILQSQHDPADPDSVLEVGFRSLQRSRRDVW